MKNKILLISIALVLVISTVVIGCGGEPIPKPPIEYEYIKLGAPLPELYNDGISARNNLQLAVDEINEAGGLVVGGVNYKFQLEVLDTNDLNPTVPATDVVAVVENLITAKNVDFIIGGPLRSETALATMELVADEEVVMISSAGFLSPCFSCKTTGCDIPPCPAALYPGDPDRYKYCFRTQGGAGPITEESLTLMEAIAADKGLDKTAYLMTQDVAHARGAGAGLKGLLEGAGWTVEGLDFVPSGATDFSTELDNAGASGADFLWLNFDMPESVFLVKEWANREMDMLAIGLIVPAHDSKAWSVFGGKCEYLVNIYPKAGVTPINSQASHYIDLYEAEISTAGPGLTWVAPVSYQVVYILKDALERADSLDDAAVIAALEATDMVGVYGKIAFDANHDMTCTTDPSTGAISTWVQWIDGERVTVYPDAIGDPGDIVLPPWM